MAHYALISISLILLGSLFVKQFLKNLLPERGRVDVLFIYVKYFVTLRINNITRRTSREELINPVADAHLHNSDLIYHFTTGENASNVSQYRGIVPTVLVYHFPHFSTFLAGQYLQIDRCERTAHFVEFTGDRCARRWQFPFNTTMHASRNGMRSRMQYAHDTTWHRHSSRKTRIYSCKFTIKPR